MRVEIRSEDCAVISGYVNAVERRSKVLLYVQLQNANEKGMI